VDQNINLALGSKVGMWSVVLVPSGKGLCGFGERLEKKWCRQTSLNLSLLSGQGHTKETGNHNAAAISENCCQLELNTCY
jgi:hypothetical protein